MKEACWDLLVGTYCACWNTPPTVTSILLYSKYTVAVALESWYRRVRFVLPYNEGRNMPITPNPGRLAHTHVLELISSWKGGFNRRRTSRMGAHVGKQVVNIAIA